MMLEHPGGPSATARQHMARLAPSYAATFDPVEIERHAVMTARLDHARPVTVDVESLADGRTRVTIVGYDYLGVLSLICGLMFASGYSILDGYVYTYEPAAAAQGDANGHRKIVDVFTVAPVAATDESRTGDTASFSWPAYEAELLRLVRHLQENRGREAQGELAKRVAGALRPRVAEPVALPPVEIEIDNEASDRYTVLQISAPDTPGFLYEFTNALALSGVHISQVFVVSAGARVRDTLFVTDRRGEKITTPDRQRELRAATVLIKHFTHLLPRSPNPEAALIHFHEYLGELFARPSWPDELASLERPEVLDALARLLGVSEFLWDDFLRMQYENLFPVVANVDGLGQARGQDELRAELAVALKGADLRLGDWRDRLNGFKDREMFRIDMRHILGQTPSFAAFSAELTDLVEVVIAAAAEQVERDLRVQHGAPLDKDGGLARLAVAGLGKCGGRELGFASDIELMFLFAGSGETEGPRPIGTPEYYEKVVVETTRAIRARREGIFQIDLQLRPYAKAGSLAVSLDAFRRYFAPGGPAWPYERQALVKLRPIAGDVALGRELEALRDEFVYTGAPFDTAAMRAMRERQLRHLVEPGRINAKFSKGGLVDLEYIVQGLQMAHGHRDAALRTTNTGAAIEGLSSAGIISAENAARLVESLNFLQQLINALRMVRGNSKDLTVPPVESEEFAFLARRLGYGNDAERLSVTLNETMGWVQRLEGRLLG
jgi:[glutamine synthetase] adenylyltransferase / [glutamine synthetase]-adenylyl-L-tyrosine phosphorylase